MKCTQANQLWRSKVLIALCLTFLLSGCSTGRPERAETIHLIGEGRAEPASDIVQRINEGDFGKNGIILRGFPGDVINVTLAASGPFVKGREQTEMSFELARDLWIFVNDSGVRLSLDGKHYEKPEKLLTGQLSAGFSLDKKSLKNQLDIELSGQLKD